jgi:drug/metabolite transporter (DMT)-like permease
MNEQRRAAVTLVVLAFAAIYLIWGSTFLAIRWVVAEVPPVLMAGARFVVAGAILCAAAALRGAARPSWTQWGAAAVVGFLLFEGNALVGWATRRVPSGLAALMLATIPLWMSGMDSLRPGAARLSVRQKAGFALGLAGMVVLVGPGKLLGAGSIDPWAAGALVLSALSWSVGSLLSRRLPRSADPIAAAGMPMVAGGAVLLAYALLAGDAAGVVSAGVSWRVALSWGYLVVFGSVVAFTAYSWLLGRVAPARVSTYAFVNPVVALALGALVADEPLNARNVLAAVLIVGAVALIVLPARQRPAPAPAVPVPSAPAPAPAALAAALAAAPGPRQGRLAA